MVDVRQLCIVLMRTMPSTKSFGHSGGFFFAVRGPLRPLCPLVGGVLSFSPPSRSVMRWSKTTQRHQDVRSVRAVGGNRNMLSISSAMLVVMWYNNNSSSLSFFPTNTRLTFCLFHDIDILSFVFSRCTDLVQANQLCPRQQFGCLAMEMVAELAKAS